MSGMFNAKTKSEAIANISSRLSMITDQGLIDYIADLVLQYPKQRPKLRKFPSWVSQHESKPSFALSAGDLLFMFAVRTVAKGKYEVTPIRYGGSEDSVFFHQREQLSSGQIAPTQTVGVFITESAGTSNRYWSVDVWVGQAERIAGQHRKLIE